MNNYKSSDVQIYLTKNKSTFFRIWKWFLACSYPVILPFDKTLTAFHKAKRWHISTTATANNECVKISENTLRKNPVYGKKLTTLVCISESVLSCDSDGLFSSGFGDFFHIGWHTLNVAYGTYKNIHEYIYICFL